MVKLNFLSKFIKTFYPFRFWGSVARLHHHEIPHPICVEYFARGIRFIKIVTRRRV